jgi:acetylornithine/succinyldiaminopimelate/putrescine aminotransferase
MIGMSKLFLRHVAQTGPAPAMLEVERAEGIYLYDPSGTRYVDLNSGYCVSALGHGHPAVVEAVHVQASRYMHTSAFGEHVQSPQVRFAEKLHRVLDESLDCVFFVNSGSEAVEGAMKLAKRVTGRHEIVAAHNAYHGSTQGADSLRSDIEYIDAFMPLLPGIRHVRFSDFEDLASITQHSAAVIIEPVQGEAGVRLPAPGYLEALRARCTEMGALLIFDEIQTGMGRTGHMFAHQGYGVTPDILLLAKALGGGMPLGAFISNKQYLDAFSRDPELGHLTTFGGHPVCCAAGLAAMEVMMVGSLLAGVHERTAQFVAGLEHDAVDEIRHAGLLMAVELKADIDAGEFVSRARDHGIITDQFLFHPQAFRIAPPLIITKEEVNMVCQSIRRALDEM